MNVCILGVTGSIGLNTVKVCKNLGYKITGITCNTDYMKLIQIIRQFALKDDLSCIGISDPLSKERFESEFFVSGFKLFTKNDANRMCIIESGADIVVNALVGSAGIEPSFIATSHCKRLALANKETIVAAADPVLANAKKHHCEIVPIDSEHGAILQCLEDNPIKKIHITASGGPFWQYKKEQLEKVTVEQALRHPNWEMGKKITIDSATMMNKGFEVIEAAKLYSLQADKINVLIHPTSIVHSLVEYFDGSIKAQLSACDMKISIQYALTHPKRFKNDYDKLDLNNLELSFFKPDMTLFKCLALAYDAIIQGGTLSTVINGANDVCVDSFLNKRIGFLDISDIIERVMQDHDNVHAESIEHILEIDRWAKNCAYKYGGK